MQPVQEAKFPPPPRSAHRPRPTLLERRQALHRLGIATGLATLRSFTLPAAGLLTAALSHAGPQLEEPLADSVRTALSAAIAAADPPRLESAEGSASDERRRWFEAASRQLSRYKSEAQIRHEFLQTLAYEATRAGLEPALVLGLVEVESAFRKYAISAAGARGYMQVMPFWARLIGDGDVARLFHTQTNLRFGCVILRHYLDREQGDLFHALGRYNGSRGQSAYPQAVLAARQRWRRLG